MPAAAILEPPIETFTVYANEDSVKEALIRIFGNRPVQLFASNPQANGHVRISGVLLPGLKPIGKGKWALNRASRLITAFANDRKLRKLSYAWRIRWSIRPRDRRPVATFTAG